MRSSAGIAVAYILWGCLRVAAAAPEQLVLGGLKTPNAFSLALDATGTAYTVENKDPSAVRRTTPGGCSVVLAAAPRIQGGRGIAASADGTVYVTSTITRNLLRIAPDGSITELMTSPQFVALTGATGPWTPLAVGIHPDGSAVYVTEVNTPNVVRVDTVTGVASVAYPREGDPAIGTRNAKGLAVDAAGNVFLAAGVDHKVLKIPADGSPATVVVQNGTDGVSIAEAFSVRVDGNGTVYVAGFQSDNVIKVIPGATPSATQIIGPADGLDGPRDLAIGPDGAVYVASAEPAPDAVVKYGVFRIPAGGVPERIDDPQDDAKLTKPKSIAVDHRGNVYLTGEVSGNLVRIATQPTTCGDGDVDADAGETCDFAAAGSACCCSTDCTHHAAGTLCATDDNGCTDDVCDAGGACAHLPNTLPCEDGLFCNGADRCDGGACQHAGDPCVAGPECGNQCTEAGGGSCNLPAGSACSEDDNPCTATQCDGAGACVPAPANAGALCREAAAICDAAETCTGLSTECPADLFASSGTCRAATGECDVEEVCTGTSPDCPADGIIRPGTPCSAGTCNALGQCQRGGGGGGRCGDGTLDEGEECDLGELNGAPENGGSCCSSQCVLRSAAFRCRYRDSVCQKDRTCADSTDGVCPDGLPIDVAAICRPAAGECDVPEVCDADSPLCPADATKPAGTPCSAGTCNAAGQCRRGGDGGGSCGDGQLDEGEQCDLGTLRNGAGENGDSCCTADCLLRSDAFICRARGTVCEKDRTCAGSTDGACPTGHLKEPDDQLCSAPGQGLVDGCNLRRCNDGICAVPICSVDVQPITPENAALPKEFTVVCRRTERSQVRACSAVGYLDARAVLGGTRGRAAAPTCTRLAARYASGCGELDPLLPYCRMVERQLGKDGILTGRCKRLVGAQLPQRRCMKLLAKLSAAPCAATARAGVAPWFRVETTLTDIVAPPDQIESTTVTTVCDRGRCEEVATAE